MLRAFRSVRARTAGTPQSYVKPGGQILFLPMRTVIRSDTDPFVPPAASDDRARRPIARLQVHPKAGHFMAENGVTSLPTLLDLILSR